MRSESSGQIITFYSYKGGTGRTMALANIACILAERQQTNGGKEVLVIDWDLEAPGLHRYFGGKPVDGRWHPYREEAQNTGPGLIDMFYEMDRTIDAYIKEQNISHGEEFARAVIDGINLDRYIVSTPVRGLSLLRAGHFNPKEPNGYAERVNRFDWEALYKKSPHLIRVFGEALASKYSYVLIDSRTGVTDISGICTMLLPEKLVVVFTPNMQSLRGGIDLIRRATDYRKESADLRPLLIFPLVSRVEANEPELRHDWRFGDLKKDTPSYQREFEAILSEVYEKKRGAIDLSRYFDEVQIQQIPRYAYGEAIAVLVEKTSDRFSLQRSYRVFASRLIELRLPWEGEAKDDLAKGSQSNISLIIGRLLEGLRLRSVRRILTALILLISISFSVLLSVQLTSARRAWKESLAANVSMQKKIEGIRTSQGLAVEREKRIGDLRAQLSQVSKDRDIARSEATKARNVSDNLKLFLNRALNERAVAQERMASCENQVNDYQRQYRDSKSEIYTLRNVVENCQKNGDQIQTSLTECVKRCGRSVPE